MGGVQELELAGHVGLGHLQGRQRRSAKVVQRAPIDGGVGERVVDDAGGAASLGTRSSG